MGWWKLIGILGESRYSTPVIQLTPGTHGLWDTPGELEVRWAEGGSVWGEALSKSKEADEAGRTFGS